MPIKLAKAFALRKSSTFGPTATATADTASTPSFKVLSRAEPEKRPAAGPAVFDSPPRDRGPLPVPPQWRARDALGLRRPHQTSNRGSSGAASGSSGYGDRSSSSARLSSTSTLPSSADVEGADDLPARKPVSQSQSRPAKSSAFASQPASCPLLDHSPPSHDGLLPSAYHLADDRIATSPSYAGVADPPKLDGDLDLDFGAASFGDLFAHINRRQSALLLEPTALPQTSTTPRSESSPALLSRQSEPLRPAITSPNRKMLTPSLDAPTNATRPAQPSSPSSRSLGEAVLPIGASSPSDIRGASSSAQRLLPHLPVDSPAAPTGRASRYAPHGGPVIVLPGSDDVVDADAATVMHSYRKSRAFGDLERPPDDFLHDEQDLGPVATTSAGDRFGNYGRPRDTLLPAGNGRYSVGPAQLLGKRVSMAAGNEAHMDPSGAMQLYTESIAYTEPTAYAEPRTYTEPMTGMASSNATSRAEYERQLVEQALGRGTDPEDEPDGNDYMNAVEAKAELRRKTLLQTHRPEAELSVQRQRVMIGAETATSHRPLPPRPVDERSSQSAPNITISYSDAQLERSMAAADVAALRDDDEDEDMPLALLQVQGFASRDRPASRAVGPAFGNTLHPQSSGQARARPSTAGLPVAARPKSELPPFAKKLPQDPFQAAGRSRESTFVASRDRAASMYSYPSGTSTSLPAGGLIGVIAHEERARALRRGSNINLHQTGYFTPAVPPQEAPAAAAPARGSSEALVRQLGENMLMLQTQMQQVLMSQARQQNPGPDGMHGNSTGLGTTLVPPSFQRTMTMPAVAADHRPASYAASNFLGSQYPAVAGRRSVYSSDASALAPAPRMSMASSPFLPAGSAYPPSRQSMYRQHHSSQPMLSLYHQQEHEYGQRGSMAGVYTPSIAPSERSNVGQASRYRPVSQHALGAGESAAAGNKAASAIAASKPLGPKARRGGTTSVSQQEPVAAAPSARLKAVDRLRAVSFWGGSNKSTPKPVVAESDSSEEEGWASMKKQQRTQHGRVQHRAKHSESPSLRELYPHGL